MNVLHPEFNFLDFLVPLNLVAGVLGFLMAWLTVAVLERLQLTRYVRNVSLFFIALAVLLAGLTDWLVNLGESMIRKILGYGLTLAVAVAGGWIVWGEYQHYTDDPWTRDGQVRANVVGIAPRVPGPIIRIAVIDNLQVKQGDLLFEIDPADYHAAVEQAEAQVLAAQAALTQRKQELDRQTALFQKKVNALQEYQDAQDNYDSAQANLASAKANLLTSELKLSYTKVYSSVNGEVTNLDISEGAYASAGQQVMALVDRDSYWIAAYFKETQLRHISAGDTVIISLMGNEDLPFRGTVRSVGWGIFVTDGSSGQGTALLPSVSPTIDWFRLPQRFPVRIQVDSSAQMELRIGQTVSVAISHGPQSTVFDKRLTSIGFGRLPTPSNR